MKVTITVSFFEEEALIEIRSGILVHKKSIVSGKKALRQDGIKRSGKADYYGEFKKIIAFIKRASMMQPYVCVEKAVIRERNVFTGQVYFWYYSFVYPMMPMVFVYRVNKSEFLVHAKIELKVDTIKGGIALWKILQRF